ncbi:MAG TPA: Mrp/NBP35 family ATP-binding protein [Candidatus Methylomirabilis sp.]|nr:Mrp/NBP35 family ATP-binding protein [Candidatus Methylomirabilis sp.]HSB77901.1 Mrp/NBP35 family ATP-binding protein [Candidatus Methylomirabilis sp.]
MVTEQAVLRALATIQDPDLHRDIVSLGFIKGLKIDGGKVAFSIELTTPACPVRQQMEDGARTAVSALPGVQEVDVTMTSRVTTARTSHSDYLPGVRNTVAVASGKGGVGKSTVAANLAVALMRSGARVGLLDTDVYGPSIPTLMGASGELTHGTNGKVIPPVLHGVKIMSMGFFLPRNDAVIWRGPMLHKMIQEFLGRVEWGELDYLVMDLPPGTGDIQLSLCQSIPLTGAVIVSTPQDLALQVASKAVLMFNKLKVPILGIVENMSYHACSHCGQRDDIFGHGGAREASLQTGLPFLGEIPLDAGIRIKSDGGTPVALEGPEVPVAAAFHEVAARLAAQISILNAAAPAQAPEPVVVMQ